MIDGWMYSGGQTWMDETRERIKTPLFLFLLICRTSASIGAWKCNFRSCYENYDRQTNQSIDGHDVVHRKVALPIIIGRMRNVTGACVYTATSAAQTSRETQAYILVT